MACKINYRHCKCLTNVSNRKVLAPHLVSYKIGKSALRSASLRTSTIRTWVPTARNASLTKVPCHHKSRSRCNWRRREWAACKPSRSRSTIRTLPPAMSILTRIRSLGGRMKYWFHRRGRSMGRMHRPPRSSRIGVRCSSRLRRSRARDRHRRV